jgi:uncharacterized protein (DUF169 family)
MDIVLRDKFLTLWQKYFNHAELPITFYYSGQPVITDAATGSNSPSCIIGTLAQVRAGASMSFSAENIKCFGGKRYLGFSQTVRPDFADFLSCGVPGKTYGERYVKSPEMVREIVKNTPPFTAPAKYITFKRWDKLENTDNPDVVIFFAAPDVLSGLYTLARFDETDRAAVQAPFGSGCAAIVQNPYLEQQSAHPHPILGMFDPSARPFVQQDILTIAIPMKKFTAVVENMQESFLITPAWEKVQSRIP